MPQDPADAPPARPQPAEPQAHVVAAVPVPAPGGKSRTQQAFEEFAFTGAAVAVLVVLGVGLGLLLRMRLRDRIERGALASDRRPVTTMLLGLGTALAGLVAWAIAEKSRAPFLMWSVVTAWTLLFVLGFAADALRTARRIGRGEGAGGFTIGWIVRGAAFAVPFAWPLVGAYLVVSALGNPLAALLGPKESTAPSGGSSPER